MDASAVFTENKKVSTKFLGVVFGYLFIGLAISALVGFGFAFFLANSYAGEGGNYLNETGTFILAGVLIASVIGCWVDTFVISISSMKSGKAPWVGYVIYAILMGLCFSAFILIPGVTFGLIGEAFGITAAIFFVMFLIGYFSPVNLNIFAFLGIAILIGVMLCSLTFGIMALVIGTWYTFDYLVSLAIIVACVLFIGFDAHNIGKIAERGMTNTNVALYCAFTLYGDFVALFFRILYILVLSKSRD